MSQSFRSARAAFQTEEPSRFLTGCLFCCRAYGRMFTRWDQFTGRTSRSEFWGATLVHVSVGSALALVPEDMGLIAAVLWLAALLYGVATIFPYAALTQRRLHDTGRSGWTQFLALVPVAGPVALMVFLCGQGEEGPNQFGEAPEPGPFTGSMPSVCEF